MLYYLVHIHSLSEDIIGFECVPTPPSNDGTVDYDRPGIRGWLTDKGWKVKCFEDYLTGDTRFPPSCFSLAEEIITALDEGREKIRGHEGSLMQGHASIRVQLAQPDDVRQPRATGKLAKDLKESEAEQAIAGAFESKFEMENAHA